MTRTIDVDMMTDCKKFDTALNRFFKKYPQVDECWREVFEWMYETGEDFFSDNMMADGTKNTEWRYALHLDVYDESFYMAVIERA